VGAPPAVAAIFLRLLVIRAQLADVDDLVTGLRGVPRQRANPAGSVGKLVGPADRH
jgi:hypothetical protein